MPSGLDRYWGGGAGHTLVPTKTNLVGSAYKHFRTILTFFFTLMWKTTKVILCHNFPPTPGKSGQRYFQQMRKWKTMKKQLKTIKTVQNNGKQIYCSRKIFQQLKLTVWLKFLRQRESSIPPIPHQQCNCYIEYFIRGCFWFQGKFGSLFCQFVQLSFCELINHARRRGTKKF